MPCSSPSTTIRDHREIRHSNGSYQTNAFTVSEYARAKTLSGSNDRTFFRFDRPSILTELTKRPFLIHRLRFGRLAHTSRIRIDQLDSVLHRVDWIRRCLVCHLRVKWCKFSTEIYRLEWRRKENECFSLSFSLSLWSLCLTMDITNRNRSFFLFYYLSESLACVFYYHWDWLKWNQVSCLRRW